MRSIPLTFEGLDASKALGLDAGNTMEAINPPAPYDFVADDVVEETLTISGTKTVAHVVDDTGERANVNWQYIGGNTVFDLEGLFISGTWQVIFSETSLGSGSAGGADLTTVWAYNA